jgi:hypothetical protein
MAQTRRDHAEMTTPRRLPPKFCTFDEKGGSQFQAVPAATPALPGMRLPWHGRQYSRFGGLCQAYVCVAGVRGSGLGVRGMNMHMVQGLSPAFGGRGIVPLQGVGALSLPVPTALPWARECEEEEYGVYTHPPHSFLCPFHSPAQRAGNRRRVIYTPCQGRIPLWCRCLHGWKKGDSGGRSL